MSGSQPTTDGTQDPRPVPTGDREPPERARLALLAGRWRLWLPVLGLALGVGVVAGALIAALEGRGAAAPDGSAGLPVLTWGAGTRPAPDFALTDQNGLPVSLRRLRGRPVIVTFIDPLCRNFCPREASVISQAVRGFASDRPAVVAVSVDPWGDSRENFREDALHWRLGPEWEWGVGSVARLRAVWRDYLVGVGVTRRVIDGITIREITHTAATYLVDPSGSERALLLYPFTAPELSAALHAMLATSD